MPGDLPDAPPASRPATVAEAGASRRSLTDSLSRVGSLVLRHLDRHFPAFGEDGALLDAMAYAVEGGKGLRGFLVLEGARLHGIDEARAGHAAAAVEFVHSYSLIHDDLPCMDDDDLRRGRPTVHRRWDEAIAVLAGDALQALAFTELATLGPLLPEGRGMALVGGLAWAAGPAGMVLGQAMDIAAETGPPLGLGEIVDLQARKTGALIHWAATAGPVMAGADAVPLAAYGRALGLAFQIADDVLDVEGDAVALGKAVHKDAEAGKATFVSLMGLDAAKSRAADLVAEACDAVAPYGDQGETLREAARFVITRRS